MQQTICAFLIAATTLAVQSSNPSNWVGVWQGELEGLRSVILTLATDDGTLQGTLVLNGINGEGGTPHIAVRETHLLLHPKLSGMTLSFEVKGLGGSSRIMDFTVEQTSSSSATIHCLNCGDNAPMVEITKAE
ncbi:MAG TPA: hypothetical protein VFE01_04005 [Terracidiphilus sp.]|jgi:hypothetical protein|nr:hypothetical protein [Terracidiphilus sp.]